MCSKVPSSHFSDTVFNVKWVAFFLSKIKPTENNFVQMFVTNLLQKIK